MSLPFSNQFKDDIAPGMYYVLAEADPAGMLEETNESNNLASLEIEILDISSAERISTHWSIKSYPNPTSDQFIVEYQGREYGTANLRLMNRSGQTVFQQSIYLQRQTKVLIPDLHLAEGLYFIQIFNADIQWHDRVLVIK